VVGLALYSLNAHAQLSSSDVLDTVLQKYQSQASGWGSAFTTAATYLFWSLAVISMVWTHGFMALRKADIGEFFAEFIRFTIFTGFYYWLLTSGSTLAMAILKSMQQLGSNANHSGTTVSPSKIVDIGFQIFYTVVDQSSAWSPVTSACGILMGVVILVVLALIATNMLILLVSAWFLAYAGIFFLGFGGSRWTSEMAISYYKTALSLGTQLMAMILLVGIGQGFIQDFNAKMAPGMNLKDMSVMLVAAAVLLALVNKVPGQLAALVGGGAAASPGFGAGAALGAAAMATAAAATGAAAMAAGAKSIAGGAQALMAAVGKANENMATGGGMFAGSGMGAGGASGGGGGAASAMGGNGSDAAPAASSGAGGGSSGGGGGGDAGSTSPGSGSSDGGSSGGGEAGASSSGEGGASGGGAGAGGGGEGGASGGGAEAGSGSGKAPSAARQMASVVGRYSADVAANLAKGGFAVGKEKMQATAASIKSDISKTVGGQIAAKIAGGASAATQSASAAPQFSQNSVSGSNDTNVDRDAEKAAFANRKAS
jgi:type IV secretion system protein VirB6/type IV secretion system protein TrbL